MSRQHDQQPTSVLEAVYLIASKQGPTAIIALACVALLGYLWFTTLQGMALDLRDHVRDSGWYQRQSCISLATLAGTPKELCDQRPLEQPK